MDDENIFANFLTTVVGFTQVRHRTAIQDGIARTFGQLQLTSDDEIKDFVKGNNAANSSRPENRKILLEPKHEQYLKAILFELKDREQCHAPPSAIMLANLNEQSIMTLKAARVEALTTAKSRSSVILPEMKIDK